MRFNLHASNTPYSKLNAPGGMNWSNNMDTRYMIMLEDERLCIPCDTADVYQALTDVIKALIAGNYTTPVNYGNLVVFISERAEALDYNQCKVGDAVRGYEVIVRNAVGRLVVCKQLLVFDNSVAVCTGFNVIAVPPAKVHNALELLCGGEFLPLEADGGLKAGVYYRDLNGRINSPKTKMFDQDNVVIYEYVESVSMEHNTACITRVYRQGALYTAITVQHSGLGWQVNVVIGIKSFCVQLSSPFAGIDVLATGQAKQLWRQTRHTMLACLKYLPVTRPWARRQLAEAFTDQFVGACFEPIAAVGQAKAYVTCLANTYVQFAALGGDAREQWYAMVRATEKLERSAYTDLLPKCKEIKLANGSVLYDGESLARHGSVCVPFVKTEYGLLNARLSGRCRARSPEQEFLLHDAGEKLLEDAEKYEKACHVLTHG